MGLLRMIPFAPDYTITRAGEIRHESNRHKPVPHSVHQGKYGMKHLRVEIDGEQIYVWKILSLVWYDSKLMLNRDGGLLRWAPEDTFTLHELNYVTASKSPTPVIDREEIQYIWYLYQQKKAACWQMAEKTNLMSHGFDDYKAIIKDILIASVR